MTQSKELVWGRCDYLHCIEADRQLKSSRNVDVKQSQKPRNKWTCLQTYQLMLIVRMYRKCDEHKCTVKYKHQNMCLKMESGFVTPPINKVDFW